MNWHMRDGLGSPIKAFAVAFGIFALFDSTVVGQDYGVAVTNPPPPPPPVPPRPPSPNALASHHDDGNASYGTLGYGPPGTFPGFQGFGLGYHLGYGYGGDALGVGAEGGYPLYGGPGYPHPAPCLRRIGGITPFFFYGGPGYPTPDHPNYFGGFGPLVLDQPVVTVATETGEPVRATDFGPFTGGVTDPEALFAPFVARAAAGAAKMEIAPTPPAAVPGAPVPPTPPPSIPPGASLLSTPPAVGARPELSTVGRTLGIEEEPAVDANGIGGIKVANVYSGAAAETAGLHVGDLIYSSNGYLTRVRGNLTWVINHAAPNKALTMRVLSASDGKEHSVTAQLR